MLINTELKSKSLAQLQSANERLWVFLALQLLSSPKQGSVSILIITTAYWDKHGEFFTALKMILGIASKTIPN